MNLVSQPSLSARDSIGVAAVGLVFLGFSIWLTADGGISWFVLCVGLGLGIVVGVVEWRLTRLRPEPRFSRVRNAIGLWRPWIAFAALYLIVGTRGGLVIVTAFYAAWFAVLAALRRPRGQAG